MSLKPLNYCLCHLSKSYIQFPQMAHKTDKCFELVGHWTELFAITIRISLPLITLQIGFTLSLAVNRYHCRSDSNQCIIILLSLSPLFGRFTLGFTLGSPITAITRSDSSATADARQGVDVRTSDP